MTDLIVDFGNRQRHYFTLAYLSPPAYELQREAQPMSYPAFLDRYTLRRAIPSLLPRSPCESGDARRILLGALLAWLLWLPLLAQVVGARVPILVYHRFGATVADSMTVRRASFESQLRYLQANGYTPIPLRQWLDHLAGKGALPPKPVVITADDGHRSVYSDMLPLVQRYRIPVTLFVYPSAISNAPYALTWSQLAALRQSGWFDVQSHTYWHPNFRTEKRRLAQADYLRLVRWQLDQSKRVLQQRLGQPVDLLAWPFGLVDDELQREAAAAGYRAGFILGQRAASTADAMLAQPRFLMADNHVGAVFGRMLGDTREAAR